MMKWGLVPYCSKTVKLKYSTINADANNLTTSGVWREPFKRRRCLVPADWFYEWPVVDGEKQARAFAPKDGSLCLAKMPSVCKKDLRFDVANSRVEDFRPERRTYDGHGRSRRLCQLGRKGKADTPLLSSRFNSRL